MYKKVMDRGEVGSIFRESDNAFIPLSEENVDYQQFLTYLQSNNLTIDDIPVYA